MLDDQICRATGLRYGAFTEEQTRSHEAMRESILPEVSIARGVFWRFQNLSAPSEAWALMLCRMECGLMYARYKDAEHTILADTDTYFEFPDGSMLYLSYDGKLHRWRDEISEDERAKYKRVFGLVPRDLLLGRVLG
jgi:hypothetical protein